MSPVPPQYFDLIESAIAGNKNDLRTLLQQLSANDTQQQAALGLPSSTTRQNAAPPPPAALSVAGANGAFNVTVSPSAATQPGTVWHEISSSPVKGFTSGVAVHALTTATNLTVNAPKQNLFFRVRSSYNKTVFNQPVLHGQTAVGSGLVSSAATNEAGAFNQTNYAVVTSTLEGSAAAIQISGPGGALTNPTAVKGGAESPLPGATILNVSPGSQQFVAWDGARYSLHPTLADVFDDALTPVGAVTVGSGVAGGGGIAGGNGGRLTNFEGALGLTGDVVSSAASGTAAVVGVNNAAVPASANYIGTNSDGQLIGAEIPVATNSSPGIVQPDNVTVFVDGAGVMSAAALGNDFTQAFMLMGA